ncbi:MAG: Pr6Pr family membrane protein [Candidatus Eremiobacteraeota bacterium]|nr:Pr6Pr family membrane protein [Candidatus Eremiobacteraeota bacterium]
MDFRSDTRLQRLCLGCIAVVAWCALVLQLYVMLKTSGAAATPPLWTLADFLSYFTIWTNALVAICVTVLLLWPNTRLGRFFSQSGTQTAIASYIAFVSIAYNILLRHIWNPQGAAMVADELLHDVGPIFYIVYWIGLSPKAGLRFLDAVPWLVYPLAYVAFAMARGALVHRYAYYFIDVDKLGIAAVVRNIGGLIVAFLVLGIVFLALARVLTRRTSEAARA